MDIIYLTYVGLINECKKLGMNERVSETSGKWNYKTMRYVNFAFLWTEKHCGLILGLRNE